MGLFHDHVSYDINPLSAFREPIPSPWNAQHEANDSYSSLLDNRRLFTVFVTMRPRRHPLLLPILRLNYFLSRLKQDIRYSPTISNTLYSSKWGHDQGLTVMLLENQHRSQPHSTSSTSPNQNALLLRLF